MRNFLITTALLAVILCGCRTTNGSAAPSDWNDWAQWVEQRHQVGDAQGHGPDVGSSEWAHALDYQLGITDSQGHGPDIRSAEWRQAVERKLRR